MGCGPGPGRQVTLEQYQQENPDDITVIGDVYTFVGDHTIPAGVEIIFGATDTLTINVGVEVTLDGKLNILQQTDGFTRITVDGTFIMVDCSEIEFGDIINGGIGILLNSSATFNQTGGSITIILVDESVSSGIRLNGNGALFNATGGTIEIDTVSNICQGIEVRDDAIFNAAGVTIQIDTVINNAIGIGIINNGIFNASAGTIQIDAVTQGAFGINVQTSGFFNQSGTSVITIQNVTERGKGILVFNDSGTTTVFNQTEGSIIISLVSSDISDGIEIVNTGSEFTASGGTIQIDTVTDRAEGINVRDGGEFTQTGTNITFRQLTTNAIAIEITSDSTFTKAIGPTISITNASTGGGTSGMVVTGTSPFPSGVVTNLGPDDSIDMTHSDTPYTPSIDPFGPPWDGGGSSRPFYAP